MSYLLSVLADKPLGFWMMDDTTPFQDYSGYGRTGVVNAGTPTTAASLVANAAFSQVFSNSNNAKFDSPIYQQGYEKQAFSLEASFRVVDESGSTSAQKILSSASNYDGIYVNGTIITFSTKYLTAGECAASWDIQSKRNVHVVGVHTQDKNSLYVDGVLVAETAISDAQKIDSFVATDGKLWLGSSASAQKVMVNGLAIYGLPLSDDVVKAHFNAARRTILAQAIPGSFGGTRFPMSINLADTFMRTLWSNDSDWNIGVPSQVTIMNNRLQPQLIAGVSVAGNWQSVLHLDCGQTSVFGLSLDWDGYGVVVEASLDGTTWETAVRGMRLALIPVGFNPTDKDLFIKVSFPGGVADDPAYLDNLSATGFLTGKNPDVDGRTITFNAPASQMKDAQPIEMRDDFGVRLNGGSVVLGPDVADTPVPAYSINIWLKKLTGVDPTITLPGGGTATTYRNGVAGSTLNQGEWVMYTIVKSVAITTSITISGNVQIGQIELFNSQLTAQNVADLYASSVGVLALPVPETNVIGMSSPNPSTRLYDYAWSITSAG
jgi:hypothetical protein